ncbi:fasciclin domain-containing protein [Sphingobacterium sp. LRF_L2]|uniref:fasciclin domain-containing protein n=1 Tax=Sphingobacterium sp. LRF_L2 TaxID=3369421 RepID=UPI003F63F490
MKKIWKTIGGYACWCVLALCCFVACKKEVFKQTTDDGVNITGYIDNNPEQYSSLSEILYRSQTAGYLGAYGTYTLFAPDNASIDAWIKSEGKSSLNDFTDAQLLDFVKYHVVRDTLSSVRFTDGKIKTPTLFGEYLYTDVVNGLFRVNKSALITKSNIECGNGWIHEIDHVLVPPPLSLAETIEANADYSIFAEALKATGFYDTLYFERGTTVAAEKRFQTAIVESNAVFADSGIYNFDDLKAKYSQTGNPKNPADSLWLFVAYHLSNNGSFLEDIISASTIYTLAPKEIISTKLSGLRILLNDDEFNGVYEPGAELIRVKSDVMASNGVLHESAQTFAIKVRQQMPIYFDVATSPELKAALGSAYGAVNGVMDLVANGAPIATSIGFDKLDYITIATNKYRYYGELTNRRPYANGDLLDLSVGAAAASNRLKYFELKTPYLVKGRYKVWICYAQNSNGPQMQVSFNPGKSDEQILPNIVFFNQSLTASGVTTANMGLATADNLMLAQGYKRYMATSTDYNANGVVGVKGTSGTYADVSVGRLAGTIEVGTTDRHIIRLTAVGGSYASNNTYLDMIHFIPADDVEQNYPRFHPYPGELFYRPQ